jgi:hypothetical protein
MRSIGLIAGFLLLGLFAFIMAGQFIGFSTSGDLSGVPQQIFDVFPTVIYVIAMVGFALFVLAAFWQFLAKPGGRR